MMKPTQAAMDRIKTYTDLLQTYAGNSGKVKASELDELKQNIKANTLNDLITIKTNMMSQAQARGLLELWTKSVIENLNLNYGNIEELFKTLITSQIQGYTLLINAYHAENKTVTAEFYLNDMNSTFYAESDQFLLCVETFVIGRAWREWQRKTNADSVYVGRPFNYIYSKDYPLTLLYAEFPNMWTNYYQDSNLGVSNHIFERADRLVDQIMGSTQQPQEYGALTARIYLFKVGDPFSVANDLKDKGMYMCFMFDMPGGRGKVGWGVKSYVRYVTFLDMKNNQQTHALLRYNFGRCPPSEISFPNNQTISYLSTPQDTWDGHSTGWVGG